MSSLRDLAVIAVAVWGLMPGKAAAQTFGYGRAATPAEIAAWDIDVRPDGTGLPPGGSTAKMGEDLYIVRCASCHGDFGQGEGRWPPLAGGKDNLTDDRPVKTVGSYWPYAPVLFDYIRRTMPFGAGLSLSDDQAYALTAYVLFLNDLVGEDAVIDRATLHKIEMPNRGNFNRVDGQEPDVTGIHCMTSCRAGPVRIHSDASKR